MQSSVLLKAGAKADDPNTELFESARLVAQGDIQVAGEDYSETYAYRS